MRTLREMQAQSRAGASCIANIEVMHAAVTAYVEEHGRFPSAETWNQDVAPYMQQFIDQVNEKMEDAPPYLEIDLVEPGGAPSCHFPKEEPTAIALNAYLSGTAVGEAPVDSATPILAVHGPAVANSSFKPEEFRSGADASRFDPRRFGIKTLASGEKVIAEDPLPFEMVTELPSFSLIANQPE